MKQTLAQTLLWCLLAVGLMTAGHTQAQSFPPALAGSYEGQLQAAGGIWGRVEFTVATTGKASGKITLLTKKSYGFTAPLVAGGLGTDASATVNVVAPKTGQPSPFTLSLTVLNDGTFSAAGTTLAPVDTVSYVTIPTTAVKLFTFTKLAPCPWAGLYTLAFADPTLPVGVTDARPFPTGAGYASVSISTAGVLAIKGKLADGSTLTASLKSTTNPRYNLLLTPYTALGGYFSSSFLLTDTAGSYSIIDTPENTAVAAWKKMASAKDKIYPQGFGPLALSVVMQKWTLPDTKAKQTLAQLLGTENFQFDFNMSGAGLDLVAKYFGTIPKKLTVDAKGALVPVFGDAFSPTDLKEWAKIWTGKVDPKTGVYTGTLTLTDMVDLDGVATKIPLKLIKRKLTFSGILFNVDNILVKLAYGYFILPPLDTKTDLIKAGGFDFGALLETLGLNKPSAGDVPAGTAGTYTSRVRRIVEFDWANFPVTDGIGVTVSGTMKAIPADNTDVKFTIAPDFSYIIFNGRKVPVVSNAHPIMLMFSDATAKNYRNTLTVTVYLETSTGLVYSYGAFYTQWLAANYSFVGRSFNAFVPGIATYDSPTRPTKVP